jgi:hypothetical protein
MPGQKCSPPGVVVFASWLGGGCRCGWGQQWGRQRGRHRGPMDFHRQHCSLQRVAAQRVRLQRPGFLPWKLGASNRTISPAGWHDQGQLKRCIAGRWGDGGRFSLLLCQDGPVHLCSGTSIVALCCLVVVLKAAGFDSLMCVPSMTCFVCLALARCSLVLLLL